MNLNDDERSRWLAAATREQRTAIVREVRTRERRERNPPVTRRQQMVATLEVKAIAALTAQALKLPTPAFRRWTQSRGHGNGTVFSVPHWLKDQPEPFRIYYVVHEVCHGLALNHGPDFKRAERRALKRWGLVPRYRRAYPHTLSDLDGKPVWVTTRIWMDGHWVA